MAGPDPDLDFVETKDLLAELERRFDFVIFHGAKNLGPGAIGHEHHQCLKGHLIYLQGITTDILRDLQDSARGIKTPFEGDDDPEDGC